MPHQIFNTFSKKIMVLTLELEIQHPTMTAFSLNIFANKNMTVML